MRTVVLLRNLMININVKYIKYTDETQNIRISCKSSFISVIQLKR